MEEERSLSVEEKLIRESGRKEFQILALKEERFWRQRSRINWLKDGDRNTKFSHKEASHHKCSHGIHGLWIRGVWTQDQVLIINEVESYYFNLFKDDSSKKPLLEGLVLDRISDQERRGIEKPFSEVEVYSTIMGVKGDKSLGPDGSTISFFKKCWDIMKGDLMRVRDEFYYSEEFYEHLNNTFIALIPKKRSAMELKDYRPISLLSSVYKIISKILASCLKGVLRGVISPPQGAFIEGRQILDGVLIANECIKNWRRSSRNGVICKLDLEKAYDHID